MSAYKSVLSDLSAEQPVLIAGPTASGKSALALDIVAAQGGVIINADAIQVFSDWRVLTARPSLEDEARADHLLYGHIPGTEEYSVGHWLRDVAPLLSGGKRPIIVGGTGLNFTALTEGLAEIPPTPPEIRRAADKLRAAEGLQPMIDALDADTKARIDLRNPMRVARAWEVLQTTGQGLAHWQDNTPAPLLPLHSARAFVFDAPKDWLTPRIERRFSLMLKYGALEEAQANNAGWSPEHPSSKAIGAAELIAYIRGHMTLAEAEERATILTRQYAKRQRTWFNARMKAWTPIGVT